MNLRRLSETLGLSQTTVSRALNGYPEVSEVTRRRVLDAARRYNYRPNPNATRLATGRSMTIGHVIPVGTQREMVNPIFADFMAGASETYASRNYDMLLSIVNDDEQEDAYLALAEKGAVDGLIVQGPRISEPRIEILNEVGLPFLVHGRSSNVGSNYSWLDVNNTNAFRTATNLLLDCGHRRIGLINGMEDMDFAKRRRIGYEDSLKSRDMLPDSRLMRSAKMTEPYGYQSVLEMMQTDDTPTAFLVSSIIPAMGARRAIQELGLTLGEDIDMVIHDDELSYFKNSGEQPMFTATRSSVREAGKRCAELLLDLISNPDKGPVHELWEVDLVIGSSTGSPPAIIPEG